MTAFEAWLLSSGIRLQVNEIDLKFVGHLSDVDRNDYGQRVQVDIKLFRGIIELSFSPESFGSMFNFFYAMSKI